MQQTQKADIFRAIISGFIVLRYNSGNQPPVVKQLPWPPDHPITSLCFDPTVSWLLVQTENANLFIIPALSMLDSESQVNQLWRLDDVTIISSLKPRGPPTAVLWWHSLDDQHIAIVATKLGEILFMNLLTQKLITKSDVDSTIRTIELVQDDQQTTTHLLITSTSGIQWKMLLETRGAPVAKPDSELSDMGYDNIDGMNLPVTSILNVQAIVRVNDTGPFGPHTGNFQVTEDDRFLPMRFYQFQRSECLSPQYAKGRHLISAYCDKTSILKVYDSKLEHNPLFIYKLPLGSQKVIFSDKVIFTASRLGGEHKLIALSNQKTETAGDEEKEFNREAIIQQFDISNEEKLLSVLQKSFPFYWHEKLEEQQARTSVEEAEPDGTSQNRVSAYDVQLTSHTVLDGCIIVTDSTVYECRPRISPERLCLELCLTRSDVSVAERLGISLSLDLNSLFEVAADYLLSHGNSKQANRLFQIAKSSPVKRVTCFAKNGYIQDVMPFLLQLLSKTNTEISTDEKKQLSDMVLHGLVYQLKQDTEQTGVADTLSNFLVNSTDYEDTVALKLLSEAGLEDILFEYSMARGLVIDALEVLAQQGKYRLSSQIFNLLVTRGYTAHIAQVSAGAFLQCLSATELVRIFHEKPQFVAQYPDLFLDNLAVLDLDNLLLLAEVLDPSRPLVRGFMHRRMSSRRRTSSINSLTGSGEYGGDTTSNQEQRGSDAAVMLYGFLLIVILLNKKRRDAGEPVDDSFLFKSPEEFIHSIADSVPMIRQKLPYRLVPVGCGQAHAAFIKNGELFTWGKTDSGRLGLGDVGQVISSPCRVETFSKLQIKVLNVACGHKHTIALTQQGVYGWGSSQYGQVGLNTRLTYTRPMLLDTLSQVSCVAVECGQYHSLALTDDAQVYSWGWGIHGQLGHGDVEEKLVPQHVKALANKNVVRVAGGYNHSIVLTSQGDVYAFGSGFFGQLGMGNMQKQSSPVKVATLTEKIMAIATKYFHTVAVTGTNKVYTWGCHPHGLRHFVHAQRKARMAGKQQFEQAESHLRPQLVDTSYVHGRIKQVICGSFHSCLITKDGDVYTWGRNIDGQIGNGTRADVRIPQMVTQINDRQVTSLSSGGEYNVAVDSDSQVWVWGRNEFGQLGIQHSDLKSSKGFHTSQSKNISTQVSDVAIPTLLNLSPVSAYGEGWYEGSLSESFTRSISWDRTDPNMTVEESDDSSFSSLPDLSSLGPVKYDRLVVPIILQSLASLCNCNQLMRKCLDADDWCTAAAINIHLKNYTQALSCHLKLLRDTVIKTDPTILTSSQHTLQHYFRLASQKETSVANKEEDIRNFIYQEYFQCKTALIKIRTDILSVLVWVQTVRICDQQTTKVTTSKERVKTWILQVMFHWEETDLPVPSLEDFFSNRMDHTACLLSTILFQRPHYSEVEQSDSTNPTLFSPSSKFLSKFSTKFCLKITAYVLEKIQGDMNKSHPLSFKALKQLGGDHFEDLPSSMINGDKLSYDQIWQDILQNIAKGADARKYIYVTHGEFDRLEEQLDDTDQGQTTLALFFTCGHYYTKAVFKKEIDRFNKELKLGQVKLPESISLLTEYYSRKSSLPLACPKCVLNALSSM